MTNHDADILFEKYLTDNYSPEELEKFLNSYIYSGNEFFDEHLRRLWEDRIHSFRETSFEEMEKYKKEAKKIISTSRRSMRTVKTTRKPASGYFTLSYLWRIAAVFAVLLSLTFLLYPEFNKNNHVGIAVLEKRTLNGEKKELVLTDGSLVALNVASKLEYPEIFKTDRSVRLEGEAFFDIVPDEIPFSVESGNVTVKVLGTSFNVKNYRSDEYMSVTVLTGRVQVKVQDDLIYLLPDEQLYIDKITGEFEKHKVQAIKYTQWNRGFLYFDKVPLSEVVKALERTYEVSILIHNEEPVILSGDHDNKSLEAVLESICHTTGMKCTQNGQQYILIK